MIEKPTIFLSHSSKDEEIVGRLRELLINKSANTIKIFASSDGQSIPFGRNWVHEIESALRAAKLVFVFISPNSINSKWVYFEAGFTYSKGIRVIPVAIQGVDLDKQPAPLSLLQGFNISSPAGLNNIISIINDTFNFKYPESFNESEYNSIFGAKSETRNSLFYEYSPSVYSISLRMETEDAPPREAILNYFKSKGIEFKELDREIETYGMSINFYATALEFRLDADSTAFSFPLLGHIMRMIEGDKFEFFYFDINFKPSVGCLEERYKRSSRIYKTEIKMLDSEFDEYSKDQYSKIAFKIDITYINEKSGDEKFFVTMKLRYSGEDLATIPIRDLLHLLFQLGILYYR